MSRWNNPACTAAHRDRQRAAHERLPEYGTHGYRAAKEIMGILRPGDTILDYGCGKGTFAAAMANRGHAVREYDPGIPGKDALPKPADVVVCTDVLPFIETDKVVAVTEHIRSLAKRAGYVTIPYHSPEKLAKHKGVIRTSLEPDEWKALFPDATAEMVGDGVERTRYLVLVWSA